MRDVLIIGAGPAGSLSAMLLASAGVRVTLVEQHRFPRDKVCGECLSSTGIDVLHRSRVAGLPDSIIELTHTLIHNAAGDSADIPLPRTMWGLSRHALDQLLLNNAIAAGAEVLQPARCEKIDTQANRPIVTIRDLVTNEAKTLRPDCVLLADGKPGPGATPTGEFGVKTHFATVDGPRDAIELFGVHDSYGGLAPIEDDRWNAAFVVSAKRLRDSHGDINALFDQVIAENRTLSRRMRSADRIAPWLSTPLPRSPVAAQWTRGVIPIGNAAASLEPIGGEGMGLALRSAELTALALIDAHQSREPVDVRRLRRAYQKLWTVRSIACRTVARAVSCGPLAAWIMPHMNGCDSLTGSVLSLMGK